MARTGREWTVREGEALVRGEGIEREESERKVEEGRGKRSDGQSGLGGGD